MRDIRRARSVLLLALVALVGQTLAAGLAPAAAGLESDTAALAPVRQIQERFDQRFGEPRRESDPPAAPGPGLRTYIVSLGEGLRHRSENFARGTGGNLVHLYDDALTGFSIQLAPEAAAALREHSEVLSVEEDRPVRADTQTTPTGVDRVADPGLRSQIVPNLGIDAADDIRVDAGIAVLDSGVALHGDLDVASQVDCTRSWCPAGGGDRYGHGTHVAGIAAAIDNGSGVVGVAPGADIYSVKVLGDDGTGSFSDVIAGIDWATGRAGAVDVINMSLTGVGHLDALDRAIDNALAAGISVTASAGNDASGREDVIPAKHPGVLAVSALADTNGVSGGGRGYCSGNDDRLAPSSNFGATVDVIAPGACIRSTLPGGYGIMSGTSMSAAHVAGAAALLAANGRSGASIRTTILSEGNFDWIDTSGDGRHEPLLDVSGPAFTVTGATPRATTTTTTSTSTTSTTSTTVAPPTTTTAPSSGNQPPVATIVYECRRLGCLFDGSASSDSDGAIRSFEWDFGDGSRASGSVVQHTYGTAGTFTAKLTVVDDDGSTDTDSRVLSCTLSSSRVSCR